MHMKSWEIQVGTGSRTINIPLVLKSMSDQYVQAERSHLVYRFTPATEEQLKVFPHTYNREYRGTSGGIKTTVPGTFHHLDNMFLQTMQKHGIPLISDPYGGNVRLSVIVLLFFRTLTDAALDKWMLDGKY